MYPKSIQNLIEQLMVFPGVGQKTAERYALFLLDKDKVVSVELAKALINLSENITECPNCHNFAEGALCDICADPSRNKDQICVVSSAKEIISIEKTQQYNGLYHVLGGHISTRKGIMPDDLNIDDLEYRIKENSEVILALNATVDGETTALYLSKKFSDHATITRLAFGLPIGGQLDYADELTLLKAFEGRKKM